MRAEILVEVDEFGKVLLPMRDVLRATHYRVVIEDTRIVLYPMEIVTPNALVTDSDGYTERQRQAVNEHSCPTCEAAIGMKCHITGKPEKLLEDNKSRWVDPVHSRRTALVTFD